MIEGPWEVRSDRSSGGQIVFSVERGVGEGKEVAAEGILDYGLACVVEAAMNLRDGTTE